MTLDNLLDKPSCSLEPVHGRELMTVAYLLKYHGYTFLAGEVKELAEQILKDSK
ncbi:hypothetical protein UFOVP257_92 [uncultured Caudovirales phage]|uniref:Uncharacterized protein n=1 Tax=uncultured Caudovirales phage TaxID=2100421 RepID=A0A6J5LNF4_9CAUD|nr:hypothetical protein UFOVP257_92 [uncultured Caudovirales phage]